jgi:hypothetical protein
MRSAGILDGELANRLEVARRYQVGCSLLCVVESARSKDGRITHTKECKMSTLRRHTRAFGALAVCVAAVLV